MKYDEKDNQELVLLIKKAVQGSSKAKFEIILMFENLINKKSRINGNYSQECRDYIEDKLFDAIEKFKKI